VQRWTRTDIKFKPGEFWEALVELWIIDLILVGLVLLAFTGDPGVGGSQWEAAGRLPAESTAPASS
jgi:hypothetical protein